MKTFFLTLSLLSAFSYNTVIAQTLQAHAGASRHVCPNSVNLPYPIALGGTPTATGGTPPYQYKWSFFNPPYGTYNPDRASRIMNDSNLANPSIVYFPFNKLNIPYIKLKITDAAGATAVDSLLITSSAYSIHMGPCSYNFSVNQGDDVFIKMPISVGPCVFGGIQPSTYTLTPTAYLTTPNQIESWCKPLSSISYSCMLFDAKGCTATMNNFFNVTVKPKGTGFDELNNSKHLTISPNPFTHQLFISNMQEVKTLQLFDVLGKQIKIEVQGNAILTEPNLPSGMCFLKAQFKNGATLTQKVLRE